MISKKKNKIRYYLNLIRNRMNHLFIIHALLVFLRYGDHKKIFKFYLSNNLLKKIKKEKMQKKNSNLLNQEFNKYKDYLIFNEGYQGELIPVKLSNKLRIEIIKEVKKKIKNYTSSPIAVVNIRSWLTKPNAKKIGGTTMHIDGFAPGHFKVMLYPQPLNEKFGFIKFEDESIKSIKPMGIAFKNSNIFHQGMPGKINSRFAIEITFMKTFFNCIDKPYECTFGRHLKTPLQIYRNY